MISLHACTLTCLQKYLDEARDFWGQPYVQQYSAEVCMPMWSHFGLPVCLSDAMGREQLALVYMRYWTLQSVLFITFFINYFLYHVGTKNKITYFTTLIIEWVYIYLSPIQKSQVTCAVAVYSLYKRTSDTRGQELEEEQRERREEKCLYETGGEHKRQNINNKSTLISYLIWKASLLREEE